MRRGIESAYSNQTIHGEKNCLVQSDLFPRILVMHLRRGFWKQGPTHSFGKPNLFKLSWSSLISSRTPCRRSST